MQSILILLMGSAFAAEPRLFRSVPLLEIASQQEQACLSKPAGLSTIELCLFLEIDRSMPGSPQDRVWLKARQRGSAVVVDYSALEAGVELSLPDQRYFFSGSRGQIKIEPLEPPFEPRISTELIELRKRILAKGLKVAFHPIEYSLLYEPGPELRGITLLREDLEGQHWVTHRKVEELAAIRWFVSINGTRYGMRVRDGSLDFYHVPSPKLLLSDEDPSSPQAP
ncbi:MAG: hypothetical protein HY549_02410 [Elusimicrobia bacterium]|nr:hypothetical protein [Elusimicrobiota bacterium]